MTEEKICAKCGKKVKMLFSEYKLCFDCHQNHIDVVEEKIDMVSFYNPGFRDIPLLEKAVEWLKEHRDYSLEDITIGTDECSSCLTLYVVKHHFIEVTLPKEATEE